MISIGLALLAILLAPILYLATENSKVVTERIISWWLKFYPKEERAERYEQLCADFVDTERPFTSIFRAVCFASAAIPAGSRQLQNAIGIVYALRFAALINNFLALLNLGATGYLVYLVVKVLNAPNIEIAVKFLVVVGSLFLGKFILSAFKAWNSTNTKLEEFFAEMRSSASPEESNNSDN